MTHYLFLFLALGFVQADPIPEPAPCKVTVGTAHLFGRACVSAGKRVVVAPCGDPICQVSSPGRKVTFAASVECLKDKVMPVGKLFPKYPVEVFLDWVGLEIQGKSLSTSRIIARLKSLNSEVAVIELRNEAARTRLIESLNAPPFAFKGATRLLKTDAYPAGIKYFQRSLDGFHETFEQDLKWPECQE